MDHFLILFLVACLCHVISTQSDVRLPPRITRSPREKNILYERGNALTLECIAEGTPAVRYEWNKNGFQLNTNLSRIRKESNGALMINRATEMDEGYYQCFAKNQYGTALSDMIDVRMAFLNFTTGSSTVLQKTVVEGMPFHIQAGRERSFPKPHYDWYKASEIDSISLFTPLSTSRRIQVAENGDLHFAHALPEDGEGIFSCEIYNTYLEIDTRGCYTQVTVTRNSTEINRFAPTLAFSSETPTAVPIGEIATLRCFFYGFPEPTISWIRPDNKKVISGRRYWLGNENTELMINNTAASDEGDYICTASNAQGNNTHTLQLRVGDAPKFQNANNGPCNVNVTEGQSITFSCYAIAIPEAKIVWLQNGQPINTDNPPERFVFSNDNKSLTIRNVCRDCVDRESKTDLMVIQCNASNVHGYAFAQGYLNVLKKTTVTIRGAKSVSVDFLVEMQFVFQCDATSDPSTPPSVRWYKIEPYGDLVRDEPPYIYVHEEFLIILVSQNCSTHCAKNLGEYRCIGDNGYSRERQTITLSYQYSPPTVDITMNKEIWAMWKIILVAAAIGLVLFLSGIFVDDRWKRHFGYVNRQTIERRIPNPVSVYGDVGYDSIGFPLKQIARSNERSMTRESGEYDHVGYDSIDQVLADIENREGAMTQSLDVQGLSRYESLDAPQRKAIGRGSPALDKGMTCDDVGYSMPLEEVTHGEGKDQQQINGYESVQSESEKFPQSNDQSESSNIYSDLNREDVEPNLDLGKADLNPEEVNSNTDLVSKEMNQYLDLVSSEVKPYLDMDKKEENQYLAEAPNEVNRYLDQDPEPREENPYLDLGQKEVNQYLELDPDQREVNHCVGLGPKEVNPYLELSSKEVCQYMDPEPREENQCTTCSLVSKEVNPNLDPCPNEVIPLLDLDSKEMNPYLDPGMKNVDP